MHEARPFIEQLRLQRDRALPWPLFTGENAVLIVCGMGIDNAQIATAALLGWRRPDANALLVNIGICAAPKHCRIGSLLIAKRLKCAEHESSCDLAFAPRTERIDLRSVNVPLSSPVPEAVDMEACGVYRSGEHFFEPFRMLFFKIPSDHFDPGSVTKETASSLVRARSETILNILDDAEKALAEASLPSAEEQAWLETAKTLLTPRQYDAVAQAARRYRTIHGHNAAKVFVLPAASAQKHESGPLFHTLLNVLRQ